MNRLKGIFILLVSLTLTTVLAACVNEVKEETTIAITQATEMAETTADPAEAAQGVAAVLGAEFESFRPENMTELVLDTGGRPGDRWVSGDFQALWAAIQADCQAGRLDQTDENHAGSFHFADGSTSMFFDGAHDSPYLLISMFTESGHAYIFKAYPECENILAVLNNRGVLELFGITVN